MPLLVRPGAVLPVGAVDDRPEYDYADGVTLRVHGLADGASVTTVIPTAGGDVAATFTTTRRGDRVHVSVDNPPARWRVQLAGADPVETTGSSLTVPWSDHEDRSRSALLAVLVMTSLAAPASGDQPTRSATPDCRWRSASTTCSAG